MELSEKIKSKIRKLLALAQSDNPHEALRAKTQAEAMMRKHGVTDKDCEIIEVESITLPRKTLKGSEARLLIAVCDFTGAMSFTVARWSSKRWKTTLFFVGPQHEAEIAAYSMTVLHREMQNAVAKTRKEYPAMTAAMADRYATGFAYSAARKIEALMGVREPSEPTKRAYDQRTRNAEAAKCRESKQQGHNDNALLCMGARDGENVRLNAAAADQRTKQHRLEAPHEA